MQFTKKKVYKKNKTIFILGKLNENEERFTTVNLSLLTSLLLWLP